MADACLNDTATVRLDYDETESLVADVRIAGESSVASWPYGTPAAHANGIRVDPALGTFGGLWAHPPARVARYVVDPALYPTEGSSSIPAGTLYLDSGLPAGWTLVNPSDVYPAVAFIYAGCPIYANTTGGAEVEVSLQTSHNAGATWNERDALRAVGDIGLITFPSLNDMFTLDFTPGQSRTVTARVKVDVASGTVDRIERKAIKLRALVVAAILAP